MGKSIWTYFKHGIFRQKIHSFIGLENNWKEIQSEILKIQIEPNAETRTRAESQWTAAKSFSQDCLLCKWAHFKIALSAHETSFKQESIYPPSTLSWF